MTTIAEIRQSYPQYADMSDRQLADALHEKFYSDIPRAEFDAKVGIKPDPSLEGIAKQAGVGVAKGAIGMAGTGPDFKEMAGQTAERITGSPTAGNLARTAITWSPIGPLTMGPTSQAIQRGVEGVTGPFRKPQNIAEEGAQTAGEFLLGAALPGGWAARLARVLAPAAAVETAGQTARELGPEGSEQAVRLITGLLVPTGGRSRQVEGPTRPQLRAASDAQYAEARSLPVEFSPAFGNRVADQVETALIQAGVRDHTTPGVWRSVQELRHPIGRNPNQPGPITITDIDSARQAIRGAQGQPGSPDARASGIAIRALDDALETAQTRDVVRGHQYLPQLLDTMGRARGNYRAQANAGEIERATNRAELQAASAGVGSNIDNATRQQFKAILNSPSRSRGFSRAELDAMRAIVEGSTEGNAVRHIGRLAPTGIVSAALSGGSGYALGGPTGAMLLPGIGAISKAISDRETAHRVREVSNMVRNRSPLAGNPAPTADTRAIRRVLDALLAGQSDAP